MANEKEKKVMWLKLEIEDGWQVVIPEFDIKPHSTTAIKNGKNKLAGLDCPCLPKINVGNKIIIHNSFEDNDKIDKSMRELNLN